jgi:hypothetical protein
VVFSGLMAWLQINGPTKLGNAVDALAKRLGSF